MKNTTHRVVILNNVNSALISQAILILKDGAADCETNVLEEAERIVEKYMRNNTVSASVKSKKNPHHFLFLCIGLLFIGGGLCFLAHLL